MAMMKKKTKAAEKKAGKKDIRRLKDREDEREAHRGKGKKAGHAGKKLVAETRGIKLGSDWKEVKAKSGREAKTGTGQPGTKQDDKGQAVGVSNEAKAGQQGTKGPGMAPVGVDSIAAARDFEILKYPLVTEKAVNMIDAENKLVFVVDGKATKQIVKKAVEELYKVKVL